MRILTIPKQTHKIESDYTSFYNGVGIDALVDNFGSEVIDVGWLTPGCRVMNDERPDDTWRFVGFSTTDPRIAVLENRETICRTDISKLSKPEDEE